ncbi:MAG: hypothetical protein QOH49_4299 [Acidobacteriota bacterium]|nr:hypothetical protein [Acidobacteriota bacterium]
MPTKKAAGAKGASKKGASKKRGAAAKGTCFVVMGFGKKTDFESTPTRTLDLDKTYSSIIKPAVEEAGLECIRANEIVHSGVIDVWMYEQLLKADVVVADLSTSNKNAYYELGVRHALRPYTTIIICEDGVKTFPFDVNHVAIRQYHHLGEDIGYGEAIRFRALLKDAIVRIYNEDPRPKDSPVYTFLNELTPPEMAKAIKDMAAAVATTAPAAAEEGDGVNYSKWMEEVDRAQEAGDFITAKVLLTQLRKEMKEAARKSAEWAAKGAAGKGQPVKVIERPEDKSIIQRLSLATYKSGHPTPQAALEEARELLKTLKPEESNDPETLGQWGAVHKRLWGLTRETGHLDEAVRGYERGFYLCNDYYNGINLAYLLNVRAANARSRADAVADFVQASRVREEVLSICEGLLKKEKKTKTDKLSAAARYWILATMAEAYLGIGDETGAKKKFKEAVAVIPDPKTNKWMKDTTTEQMDKLRALLAKSPLKYVREGRP